MLSHINGRAVMGETGKAIYLIDNGAKRPFPDFDTFERMKFTGSQVKHLKDAVLEKIPVGQVLPSLMNVNSSMLAKLQSQSSSSSSSSSVSSTNQVVFTYTGESEGPPKAMMSYGLTDTTDSVLLQNLTNYREKIEKSGVACWGDDYTGSRDDFLRDRFKSILGSTPVLVYPLCLRLFQLGNSFGYFINDVACADMSGAHFIGVGRHFSLIEPEQLATNAENHFAFFKALPDQIIHPNPVLNPGMVKLNMKKYCPCLQYCWENGYAPWLNRTHLVRRYLLPAIDAYLTAANALSVGTLVSNATDLSTESSTAFLPLIPHVAIQYRCGDNIGFGKTRYGLLPFYAITARIPKWARYIYVMADSPTRQKHHVYSGRCGIILQALFEYLRKHFPLAVIVMKRGGDQFLDVARLAYANITVCSASTFCLWSALANNGAAYFPLTPLVGWSGWNETAKYLGPNFHWIREVEIIKEFKQFKPWNSIINVLEGTS
jgi:hypothetical protein